MMKLYSYSSRLLTFVEAKWTLARFVTGGVLIGTILLFGFMELNQSIGNTLGSRSAKGLSAENDVLRQQLNLISPRVSKLETQAEELKERANGLHKLLQRRTNGRDTVMRFTNATGGFKPQSSMAAAKSPRP
jgi:hypothetical protein